jgi:hypothetical protein
MVERATRDLILLGVGIAGGSMSSFGPAAFSTAPSWIWSILLCLSAIFFVAGLLYLVRDLALQTNSNIKFTPTKIIIFIGFLFIAYEAILLGAPAFPKLDATADDSPDVIARLVYQDEPSILLENISGRIAKEIKWAVELWDIDEPRTYINPRPQPNAHDPLPIPVSTFDFLRPHTTGGPPSLFNTPLAAPYVKAGHRLVGSMSVVCPECARGHTYVVYITLGRGGWYSELNSLRDGQPLIPSHLNIDTVKQYAEIISETPFLLRQEIQLP